MRNLMAFYLCFTFLIPLDLRSQLKSFAPLSTTEIRVQRMVHELTGKTITLNFKEGETRTGTLVRCNGKEFLLDNDGKEETYPVWTVRSIILKPGISEGVLVAVSGMLLGGFGLGVSALSFENAPSALHWATAAVFALIGGWAGYDTFYQETETILP